MNESLKTPNITGFDGIEFKNIGITKTSGEDRHAVAVCKHEDVAIYDYEGVDACDFDDINACDHEDTFCAIAYGLSSKSSNAWKSDNPHSGIYEADIARTIDTSGTNPLANQGGNLILQSLGSCLANGGDTTVTLLANTDTKLWQGNQEVFGRDYNMIQSGYVRRLTPLECCRLQGFPDCWAKNLETPSPTKDEVDIWVEIFETHRLVTNPTNEKTGKPTKPKTRNYIKKWLKNPHTDSAEYKMWGNSLAIPNALYVLEGIVDAEHR